MLLSRHLLLKMKFFFSDKELKNEADALTPPDISAADVATGIPGQSLISPLCCQVIRDAVFLCLYKQSAGALFLELVNAKQPSLYRAKLFSFFLEGTKLLFVSEMKRW